MLAGEISTSTPHWIVDEPVKGLSEQGKSIKGAKVLVLGLSYKADIDDDRETPSLEILELFEDLGAEVASCDPLIPAAKKVRGFDLGLASAPYAAEEFARHGVVLVSSGHRTFRDLDLFAGVKLFVDTDNLFPASVLPSPVVWA